MFVLTHHERAPLAMQGGTTFTFVTDGGERLLDGLAGRAWEPAVVLASPTVTHVRYRIPR